MKTLNLLTLATVLSALSSPLVMAEEVTSVPQGQIKADKAAIKQDKAKLQADRAQLKKDRKAKKALKRKMRKEHKELEAAVKPQVTQQ